MNIIETLRSLVCILRDRKGVTALEYGIIAGILGLVLITIFSTFGSKLSTLFSRIGGSI
jgi:pilus assembly protein Flp/PilA